MAPSGYAAMPPKSGNVRAAKILDYSRYRVQDEARQVLLNQVMVWLIVFFCSHWKVPRFADPCLLSSESTYLRYITKDPNIKYIADLIFIVDENDRKNFLLKEVDIIQTIIKRMANNSFLVKGWMITIVVVTLLLKSTNDVSWLAWVPLILFWGLDAYFLRQERMYRNLYKWVVKNRLIDDTNLLDMDVKRFENDVDSFPKTMLSKTLLVLYGGIFIFLIIYETIILYYK